MTLAGWVLMIFSWSTISVLTGYCFIKVFSKKEEKTTPAILQPEVQGTAEAGRPA